MEKYVPDITGVLDRVDSMFATPAGASRLMWRQQTWMLFLAAGLVGVTFELAKYAILELRRHLYNRNRNRKNATKSRNITAETNGEPSGGGSEGGFSGDGKKRNSRWPKKNQVWRTTPHGRGRGGYRGSCMELLPLPPNFAEELRKQWGRVHDSVEEATKLGEMLIELEDYVDNSFVFSGDKIIGRHSGIKGFLKEHCPHVVYTTAMRYRTLALKAREIAKKQGKLDEFCKKCGNAQRFGARLDSHLRVTHRKIKLNCRLRNKKKRPEPGDPTSVFATLQEQARSALGQMDGQERERFVAAMQGLAQELAAD